MYLPVRDPESDGGKAIDGVGFPLFAGALFTLAVHRMSDGIERIENLWFRDRRAITLWNKTTLKIALICSLINSLTSHCSRRSRAQLRSFTGSASLVYGLIYSRTAENLIKNSFSSVSNSTVTQTASSSFPADETFKCRSSSSIRCSET